MTDKGTPPKTPKPSTNGHKGKETGKKIVFPEKK